MSDPGTSLKGKQLTVRVPGSSANLGAGFDALGLSLGIYTNLTFQLLDQEDLSIPLITLRGPIANSLPADQSNLIYRVLAHLWKDYPNLLSRIRIQIESDIPLGAGMGSSATAILGSVWAAYTLTDQYPDVGAMLAQASAIEGHPENLAASLLGGLVVCGDSFDEQRIVTQKLTWPSDWRTIVVVPQYTLTTHEARSVLPKEVSLQDAIYNIQRTALLVSAVTNHDENAMSEALHDRLHEPYRDSLVPELGHLRRRLAQSPIIGCVLSGAGSSVLVIVKDKNRGEILQQLETWAQAQAKPPDILDLNIDSKGLQEIYYGDCQ
jgi:homoserine kinase